MPSSNGEMLTLIVARRNGEASRTMFTVPMPSPNSRVLDALLHVRQHQDPTLSFRYSCRVGMCGSCAMVINGKEGLACQTTVGSLDSRIVKLEPLRALPVQKDLTVDMTPFFQSLKNAEAAFRPSEAGRRSIRQIPPGGRERALIEAQNGCITCGACFSACEWTSTRKGYLGPAALNRIYMLALDERDALGKKRLTVAARDNGALRCHTIGNCAAVCPVEVPLRTGLQRLKGLLASGEAMAGIE